MVFILEKTGTGYSAYNDEGGTIIGSTGYDLLELRKNIVEATNLYYDCLGIGLISEDQIELVQSSHNH